MFAGTYDCLIIPNTVEMESRFEHALKEVRQFMLTYERGNVVLATPSDNRCSGCHWGEPRRYVPGKSDTVLNGQAIPAHPTNDARGRPFHSTCGDRFDNWVPPHKDSVALEIARPD